MPKESVPDWTKKTFVEYGELIFDILTAPPEIYKQTPEQAKFIHSILKPYSPKAKKILDIPCGDGRISLELLKKGYEITGIDISPAYIKRAVSKAKGNKRAEFLVQDMRKINFKNYFDAVITWYGSFGYFDEQANEKVFEKFIKSLKKNGLLIYDHKNRDHALQQLGGYYEWQPEVVYRIGKKKIYVQYLFDPFTNRIRVPIQINDSAKKLIYDIKLYTLPELLRLLEKYGMKLLKVYGDYKGNEFSTFSPRIIIVAQKK